MLFKDVDLELSKLHYMYHCTE